MTGSKILNIAIDKYMALEENFAVDERKLNKVVANRYGVGPGTLRSWRINRTSIKFDDLNGIVEMLGFKLTDLINELELKQ